MLLRVPLAVAPAGQQRAGVADGIVAVAVVHQYVHLLGLVAQHSHWPDPLAQLVLGVEVAEPLGAVIFRLLPAISSRNRSSQVSALCPAAIAPRAPPYRRAPAGVDDGKPCGSSIGEDDFDRIFGPIREQQLDYWAHPGRHRPGEINRNDESRASAIVPSQPLFPHPLR